MRRIKKISVCFLILVMPIVGFAQQAPQFSQYMYNMISINPAYAGSREIMVINVLNRNQWVGIEGAPITQTLSAHTSLPNTKMGVGLSMVNDKVGYEKTTNLLASGSYKLILDSYENYQLTFGLRVGFRKYSVDDRLLNDPDYHSDPFFRYLDPSWRPNVGVGVYFRGELFYLGLSIPELLTSIENAETYDLYRESYFLNGGLVLDLNRNLKFKPSFIIKYTNGAPISFDFSSMFLINDNVWLGGSYRFSDSFGVITNFKITKGFTVGYSYDYITSNLKIATYGSHEIILNYEFEFPKPRCKCKDLYN